MEFFATTTSEQVLVILKNLEQIKMEKKKLEKEEDSFTDQLSAAVRMLPSTKNPSLPLSASLFSAVFQQANLSEKEDNNNNIPLKKPKIEKEEDNNIPKKKKRKASTTT
jgi:hypothetical protein